MLTTSPTLYNHRWRIKSPRKVTPFWQHRGRGSRRSDRRAREALRGPRRRTQDAVPARPSQRRPAPCRHCRGADRRAHPHRAARHSTLRPAAEWGPVPSQYPRCTAGDAGPDHAIQDALIVSAADANAAGTATRNNSGTGGQVIADPRDNPFLRSPRSAGVVRTRSRATLRLRLAPRCWIRVLRAGRSGERLAGRRGRTAGISLSRPRGSRAATRCMAPSQLSAGAVRESISSPSARSGPSRCSPRWWYSC